MKRSTQVTFVIIGVLLSVILPAVATTVLDGGKDAGVNVEFNKSDGPKVIVGEDINFTNENPWATSNRITLDPWGNFTSSGKSTVRVDTFNGTWTNTSQLDVDANTLTLAINDKQTVEVGGNAESLRYTDMAVDDGTVDFIYSGPSGTTELTVHDLPASTAIAAVDEDTGDVLDSTTTSSGGVGTFDLPNSEHTVTLQTSDGGPTADDSTASPTGGETIRTENETLAIDVSDPDFPDDTVSVTYYVDGQSIGTTEISSNQTVEMEATGLSEGSHDWHVELEDGYGQTSSSSTHSFVVEHYDTVLHNDDASPSDGDGISEHSAELSIPVSDADFAHDGDDVQVDFFFDGSQVDSQNITSNQTVSTTVTVSEGGTHSWHVETADSWGNTNSSETFEFSAPSELRIYNESAPTELVDNATVELRYYYEEDADDPALIETRTTDNGTINMTGLPVDRPFVVVADTEGYLPRRIFVESLFDTQRVYLLPESKQSVNTQFELTDYSGEFPPESTVLLVQRGLNGTWQTVHGDRFGAAGEFPAQLRYNVRHRLVLLNTETGERRIAGPFTPLGDSTQEITVFPSGDISLQGTGVDISVEPELRRLDASANQEIVATIASDESTLTNWSFEIIYHNATSGANTTLAETSGTDSSGGTFSSVLNLSDRSGGRVFVITEYETDDGITESMTIEYQVTTLYENQYGLLSVLGNVKTSVPAQNQSLFTALLAVIVTMLVAGGVARVPGTSTEVIGFGAVITLAAFGVIGWIGYGPVFAGAAAWVGMAGLRRGI